MNIFDFNSNINLFKQRQDENELAHYGTRGQKWGVRKWQNYDGTFNEAGKIRYFGSKGKKEKSSDTGKKLAHPNDPHDSLTIDRLNAIKKLYPDQEEQKFGTARNPKMNLKVDPELLKEYTEDEIEDSIQNVINDIRSRAPEGPDNDPSSYDVNVNKDGSFHIDFHYDDNESEENDDMSDYETEKMMNREGWKSESVPKYNERDKEKKIVYYKDINNDEYEGKKFTIEHDDLSEYGVGNAIDDGDKALKFLNKKGSYQKILNEIADNQYDLYVDVMKDNGKKPVSKSEFIKNEGLKIREIGLDTYDSFNKGNIIIEFDPKPHSDWFGYEFDVWIDPTTGKYIELYQS